MISQRLRHSAGSLMLLTLIASAVDGCARQDTASESVEHDRPNVVLISVDTLRPDHLGSYGYPKNTSPRIDQIAAAGAVFENAVSSSSWTLPAHAALFTGLPDSVHGCDDSNRRLDESRLTLAERFAELGYRTVGFFAGPFLHPSFGLAQGFERYIDCSSYAEQSKRVALSTGSLDTPEIVGASHRDVSNPRVYAQVTHWLEHNQQTPFFMFVHFWDVHFDFVPPPPYDTMFDPDYPGNLTGEDFFRNPRVNPLMSSSDLEHILALYDGEIAWTDHHIGKILDDLETRGLLQNTIVALVSDHGEEFFEHGGKGHRSTLYDEVIRIPMILWYPEKIPAGTRIEASTSIIDIFPTLLELAGAPASDQPMGQSLVSLMQRDPGPTARLAISELHTLGHDLTTFRGSESKLLVDNASGRAWSFDLRVDPMERFGNSVGGVASDWERDLLEQSTRLRLSLIERKQAMPPSDASPELSNALVEQLQMLGYLQGESPETHFEDRPDDRTGRTATSDGVSGGD